MSTPLLEMEGPAEEIQRRLADFAGQRIRVVVTRAELAELQDEAITPSELRRQSIEEKILARFSQIPPEEQGRLPADLSDNIDHYLYGWPKK